MAGDVVSPLRGKMRRIVLFTACWRVACLPILAAAPDRPEPQTRGAKPDNVNTDEISGNSPPR